jgi:hypothetical protein
MKKFIQKTLLFLLVFLIVVEIVSRVFVDPLYFCKINTYNLRTEVGMSSYTLKKTLHVDYLFIGSSRVPATIDPKIIMDRTKKVAVVAGRGYLTAGVHYQALVNRLAECPDYLRGANVFIEYPGSSVYETPFKDEQFRVYEQNYDSRETMPHLLLPHINMSSLFQFLNKSTNSFPVKAKFILLYCCSFYRTIPFIQERLKGMDIPFLHKRESNLTTDGGIRDDIIEVANQKAMEYAKNYNKISKNLPALSESQLDESVLANLHKIIVENGGSLFLYKMPLHSVHEQVFSTPKELYNQKVFEDWLRKRNIKVIYNKDFIYRDVDFPDTWHLSKSRRAEFTSLLYSNFLDQKDK